MLRYQRAVFVICTAMVLGGIAAAQPNAPMPTNNPEAMANVKQSEAYSALLRSNPAFRKKREQIECGPIQDAQLRASCIQSFEAYASTPPAKR